MSAPYVYIWEYDVLPGMVDEFVELYGPGGSWAQLFAQAPGYLGTDLVQDREEGARFVTIDRWHSKDAFQCFRRRFGDQFDRLDRVGEELTLEESFLGEFEGVVENGGRA